MKWWLAERFLNVQNPGVHIVTQQQDSQSMNLNTLGNFLTITLGEDEVYLLIITGAVNYHDYKVYVQIFLKKKKILWCLHQVYFFLVLLFASQGGARGSELSIFLLIFTKIITKWWSSEYLQWFLILKTSSLSHFWLCPWPSLYIFIPPSNPAGSGRISIGQELEIFFLPAFHTNTQIFACWNRWNYRLIVHVHCPV